MSRVFPNHLTSCSLDKGRAKGRNTRSGCDASLEGLDLDALLDIITVEWDSLGKLASFASTPEDVVKSGKNKFRFTLEDETTGTDGLRAPQFGALHAISAHFSVGKQFDPATVVLPTGTGNGNDAGEFDL